MGTLIFYQADEPAAWTQPPLLRREPRDSRERVYGFWDAKKRKRPPLLRGWLSPA